MHADRGTVTILIKTVEIRKVGALMQDHILASNFKTLMGWEFKWL